MDNERDDLILDTLINLVEAQEGFGTLGELTAAEIKQWLCSRVGAYTAVREIGLLD